MLFLQLRFNHILCGCASAVCYDRVTAVKNRYAYLWSFKNLLHLYHPFYATQNFVLLCYNTQVDCLPPLLFYIELNVICGLNFHTVYNNTDQDAGAAVNSENRHIFCFIYLSFCIHGKL